MPGRRASSPADCSAPGRCAPRSSGCGRRRPADPMNSWTVPISRANGPSTSPGSVQQRVICLVFVDRARLGLEARDQAKTLDRQRVGAELRMRREIAGELVERRLMEPRQGDVRREFARLRRQPNANQRLLDLVAQRNQLGAALDPYPEAARLVTTAENAGPGKLQRKAAGSQSSQRFVDIGCDILSCLAD